MKSRESFNKNAKLYDEVRPSYPDELIDFIINKTKIKSDDELLEIAPGSGQATKKFIERGYKVHAIELGDKLAELFMKKFKGKNASIEVSAFEDWFPTQKNKKYKLIYCATAWHWIDENIKYKKTYDLLEDEGYLVIIWNNSIGIADNLVMEEAYKLLFAYHDETPHSTKPKSKSELEEIKNKSKEDIEKTGHYKLVDYYQKEWSIIQPKDRLIKGFYSQSSYLSLNDKIKKNLSKKLQIVFNKLPDNIETYFRSTAYICKKKI